MRQSIHLLALVLSLALVASGSASPEGESTGKSSIAVLPGFVASTESRSFRGLEPSTIVVFGKRSDIFLGLYVFDPNGNCVAHDDAGDDLAVQWIPPRSQPYSYEIRNLGMIATPLEMAIR